MRAFFRTFAVAVAAVAMQGCGGPRAEPMHPPPVAVSSVSNPAAIAKARADSARYPYTEADIQFMSAMIGHHSQAIAIAKWARTHEASAAVQRLADRIINGQQDEIVTMQRWLRDRNQPVPDAHVMSGHMAMHDSIHHAMMPGMLSPSQLSRLDQAKGAEFDRLFLTYMIQHHRGAVAMVEKLFATQGAVQDEIVFKFASDVNVDQSTEIARMESMLDALSPSQRNQQ